MRVLWILMLMGLFLSSCEEELVPTFYHPSSAYDAYRFGLVKSGLGNSLLSKKWLEAGKDCLDRGVRIKLPYQEHFYFDELQPEALAFRFSTKRGQRIEVSLKDIDSTSAQVFMDLFRVNLDTIRPFRHVASADSVQQMLAFEPRTDGEYVLRLQPELLTAGKYALVIKEVTTFTFPMAGKTETAILSVWGDPRDAGRRIHEGVDIFARRHTPILAATSGEVRYTGDRGLGGKQAWIRDKERGLSVYFAHLDSVYVRRGQYVEAGDTIGENGNSGNAITTNPHLHFGVYGDTGAIDPYHFIVPNRRVLRTVRTDDTWVGQKVKTRNPAFFDWTNERYRQSRSLLPIHQIMTVKSAWSRSYRVELPDGRQGYVRAGDLEIADGYRSKKLATPAVISRDLRAGVVLDTLPKAAKYTLLGRHDNSEYIRYNEVEGWLSEDH